MTLTPILEEMNQGSLCWPKTPYPFNSQDVLNTESYVRYSSDSTSSSAEDLALTSTSPGGLESIAQWAHAIPSWLAHEIDAANIIDSGEYEPLANSSSDCDSCSGNSITTDEGAPAADGYGPCLASPFQPGPKRVSEADNRQAKRVKFAKRKPAGDDATKDPTDVRIAALRVETRPQPEPAQTSPLQVHYTPVSPARGFVDILAEKTTSEGKMYKVIWRDSWVHADRLGDVDAIRKYKRDHGGSKWDIVD